MAQILPFKKPTRKARARPVGLCQHGYHKWEICKDKQFDVRRGMLVTVYRCRRCGTRKVETT